MTHTFTPYGGFEEDLHEVLSEWFGGFAGGYGNSPAARLKAALGPKPCGKRLHAFFGAGNWIEVSPEPGRWINLVCELPEGHDGPHVPTVPEELWR